MAEDNKTEEKVDQKPVESPKKEEKKLEVKKEEKVELEREYVVPLKRKVLIAVHYKRAKKAVLVLKQFLAKHMKVENRDVRLVKLDRYLNQELWYRGIKKPINSVKVKAKKIAGVVYAELAELPEYVKFQKQKDANRVNRISKPSSKSQPKQEKVEEKTQESKTEEAEKDKAVKEAGLKENKAQAKAQKHTTNASHEKNTTPRRTVLQK